MEKYLDLEGLSTFKDNIFANMPFPEIKYVTLWASMWSGSAAPYTQTVSVDEITANNDVEILKYVDYSSSQSAIANYNKSFGYLANGVGQTIDGGIEFKVFKRPTIDLDVGVRIIKKRTLYDDSTGETTTTVVEGTDIEE